MVESCTSHVQNDFHIYVKCIYGAVHMFKVGNLCRTHGRIVHLVLHRRSDEFVISIRNRKCLPLRFSMCYTEKASPTRHRPERQHNARANRRKQCSPNEIKPYSKPTLPRKRQTTPTNGHTPRRLKPTHTRLTYTRIRPHTPSHQAGDHPVPAHTERHNPPRLWTQRQL